MKENLRRDMREESFLSTKTQEGRKEKREAQICDETATLRH